jgi:hypothetical protein
MANRVKFESDKKIIHRAEKIARKKGGTIDIPFLGPQRSWSKSGNFHGDLILGRLDRALDIDKNKLDEALERQPNSYNEAADAMAEAINLRDGAEDTLKEARAKSLLKLSMDPAEGKRMNMEQVKAAVELTKRVRRAKKELRDAQLMVDKLVAREKAFSQRSFALKDMVRLRVTSDYQPDAAYEDNESERESYLRGRRERAKERAKRDNDE